MRFELLVCVRYVIGSLRDILGVGWIRLAEARAVAHKKSIARSKQIREEMNRRPSRAPTLAESQQILAQFRQQQQTAAYKKWQQVRAKLPAAKKRAELLELMASNQVRLTRTFSLATLFLIQI